MIAQVCEENRARFLAAVQGRPYFGDTLPVHLEVFAACGALMRFYVADACAAVQVKGRSAAVCGAYDAREMGAFLRMQGVCGVYVQGPVPAGYRRAQALCSLARAAGAPAPPPCPDTSRLTLDRAPPPMEVAEFVMRGENDSAVRDNFYSELCTKLSRGAARVWAVRRAGALVATAGAYALSARAAYLAAIETRGDVRGQGVGSWLTGLLAAELAASGQRVSLLCGEALVPFYEPLGFVREGVVWRCTESGAA